MSRGLGGRRGIDFALRMKLALTGIQFGWSSIAVPLTPALLPKERERVRRYRKCRGINFENAADYKSATVRAKSRLATIPFRNGDLHGAGRSIAGGVRALDGERIDS